VENFKYKIIKLTEHHPYVLADKMNDHIKEGKRDFRKFFKLVKRNKMPASASGYHLDEVNIDLLI
jgi:hypothetical protein